MEQETPFFLSSLKSSVGLPEVNFRCSQPRLIISCFNVGRRDKSLFNMLITGLLTFQQSVFRYRQPKDQRKNVVLKGAEQGAGKMAQWLKALVVIVEKLGLVRSTYTAWLTAHSSRGS